MTNDEFQKHMEDNFPRMLAGNYGGFAVGEGWYGIIESLCANIDHHIKWKRDSRARALRMDRARDKGIESVLTLLTKGKDASSWDVERAEGIMATPPAIPEYVTRVTVAQVKEKFGGLRFYYNGGDDYVRGLVTMAESWADKTCEKCGNLGTHRHGGWIRTLCDAHEAEYQKNRKY